MGIKEIIHIVACFDKGYVMPTGVMMYSACVNNPDIDINFHLVIDESVTDNEKKDLMDTISPFEGKEALFYHVDSQFYHQFPLNNNIWLTRATYYRIFLPEILPVTVDKVIYLDGDCIVRHSLKSLWNTDVSGFAVATVFEATEGIVYNYNRLRYSPAIGYFNAGVLLVNLDYWRKNHVINALLEYLSKYPERILMEDQDAMNVVLKDLKKPIHPKYNFQTGMLKRTPQFYYWEHEDELKEAIADPVIVHFTSIDKPWHAYMRYPHPYRNTFFKYQNQTKWKGIKIEKRQLKNIIRNYIGNLLRHLKILPPINPTFIDVSLID